ncbi:MAG: hypothetical protein GMKNLPBB_01899 [Myxococcota bacterium]|nr:hypothetical protein [Myxococcota bacterium]
MEKIRRGAPEQTSFDFTPVRRPTAAQPLDRPPALDAQAMRRALQRRLPGKEIHLTITQNRTRVLSYRRVAEGYHVRLHQIFLHGDSQLIDLISQYIVTNNEQAGRALDRFINEHREHIVSRQRALRLDTDGEVYDLQAVFDDLNMRYFAGKLGALRITWSRDGGRRRRRSIRLGVYEEGAKLIRIHPALDQDFVPYQVLASIVFHEMLHAVVIPDRKNGRRHVHNKQFRKLEAFFPHHKESENWISKHLDLLLSYRGSRK